MKLVRDKIPEIIEADGKTCMYVTASPKEFPGFVYDKMKEELEEFMEDPCIEEAADIMEVFGTLLNIYDIEWCDVAQYAMKKSHDRGKFENGIILMSVK
jgi:predicted house-cleaning noncanonical NTP pyrophosphatase (MazG superfamily)